MNNGVVFDEKNHIYSCGKYQYLSVTQLLKKHNIGANYDNVNPDILEKAAKRGTLIHEEVENFINKGELPTIYEEAGAICNQLEEIQKTYNLESEIITATPFDYKVLIAGKIDIRATNKGTKAVSLYDIKTYKDFTRESLYYATWQLSLYSFLERLGDPKLKIESINVIYLDKNDRGLALFKEVEPISDEEINNLIDFESMGLVYVPKTDELPLTILTENSLRKLKAFEELQNQVKAQQEAIKEVKASILDYMAKHKILKAVSFDGSITITRIEDSIRESIDSKKLKAEEPEIYSKYLVQTPTKGSLRISFK
jgi:hypothetical protein